MKNVKISLLAAGATLVLLACSSLEVDNPIEENFPKDWSAAEYLKANPDLRSLQLKDQVLIMNTLSGAENDDAAFLADTPTVELLATTYMGFTKTDFWTDKNKMKVVRAYNIYGVNNEAAVFDTLTLDTAAIERQYVVYGAIGGRPYRTCATTDANLVKKGECQQDENSAIGYSKHMYCASEGVTYCMDCDPVEDDCPEAIVDEPESSSSAAKPESSDAAGDESSSSEGGEPAADSSSSEGGEPATDSSSSEEASAESSSSAE
jgi:hypothetical protein